MRTLLVLPLLLALASCGTGRGVSGARVAAPLAIGGTATVTLGQSVPVLNGQVIHPGSVECPGIGNILPDSARTICQRAKAIEYLIAEVQSGRIVPGPAWKDCTYPSDPAWPYCVEFSIKAHVPEIRFGMSPVWVRGVIGTAPFEGCAAGVAYDAWVRVSIADLPRSYLLASWEAANSILFYHLDRRDLADGYVVSAATTYAAQACGVQ